MARARRHQTDPNADPSRSLKTVPQTSLPATPADAISQLLESTTAQEALVAELEAGRSRVGARLAAVLVPLSDRIVAARLELMRTARRKLSTGMSYRTQRDGQELILEMATDLQERFGVDVREFTDPGAEPEEDEEDDFAWARSDSAGLPPPPVRKRPPGPKLPDPEATAKGIYRSLAREFHPDKVREDSQREERADLMRRLAAAWEARDLGTLLTLLHAHGSQEAREGAMDSQSLEACRHGLQERLRELEEKVRRLRHRELPEGVVDWLPLVREPERVDKLLRKLKAPYREELEFLEEIRRWWLRPGGFEECLSDPPQGLS